MNRFGFLIILLAAFAFITQSVQAHNVFLLNDQYVGQSLGGGVSGQINSSAASSAAGPGP